MAPRDAILRGLKRVIRHHRPVSVALYLLGVFGVLSYPWLARRTFIDENAFLHGQADVGFGADEANTARAHAERAVAAARAAGGDPTDALRAWTAAELATLGLDATSHDFEPSTTHPDALANARANRTSVAVGRNLHAIARAVKAPGREGIVLVTPIGDPTSAGLAADADAVGLALALVAHLSRARWLAKDLVWLIPDARVPGGAVAATDAWLREYHHPSPRAVAAGAFPRAGALQQAYVLELPDGAKLDALETRVEGRNGALPNQDLLNTAIALARNSRLRAGLDPKRGRGADALGPIATAVAKFAQSAGGSAAERDVVSRLDDLARAGLFAAKCARGAPTGAHASFKTYAVDAVTLRGVIGVPGLGRIAGVDVARRLGAYLENLIRGSNSLVELLHHSMFYFVMVGDERFLSIAEYIAPQLALGLAMIVGAVGLALRGATRADDATNANEEDETGIGSDGDDIVTAATHDWYSALALCAAAHGVGAAAGTACLAARDAGADPRANTAAVVATLAVGHAALFAAARRFVFTEHVACGDGSPREPAWVTVKAVTLAATATALGATTFFNFPLAWALSAAIAPPCLAAGPSQRRRSSIIRAVVMAMAPVVVAAAAARAAGVPAAEAAAAFADEHRRWEGGTFALPLAFGVAWPACALSAIVCAGGEGGGREESDGESKKKR